MSRPLALLAHGTRSAAGVSVIDAVAGSVRQRLGVPVHVGYVDVIAPRAAEVVAPLRAPVVVPYFLTSGYHVHQDVPAAATLADLATITPALGAAPEVLDALVDRLSAATGQADAVLLGAAGSSWADARAEVEQVADLLAARLQRPVQAAYLSGPGPSPDEVIAGWRADGHRRIAAATLLLAPGHFHDRLAALPLDAVAAPLGAHPSLVDLVVRRYHDGLADLS